MALLEVTQRDTVDGFRLKTNQLSLQQGDLDLLTTLAKGNLVSAINELDAEIANLNVQVEEERFQIVGNSTFQLNSIYTVGSIVVHLNGVKLDPGGSSPDYIANNGSTIEFEAGLLLDGDVVLVFKYNL